ncbi:MAG: superoxide dismutase, Ni [Candidatus Portnoybacteria bacterium RIFCSPLOWO2_01_FULL_43_11]|uniref:Superoxide dismutase, Ni n=3 Tax=Candidatus Portnoyibacteriota TaxID=1817913 RepID=A0A1G2F9X4_9BACT|nr:MAG: superoxide dismutase, Ni [Candidatus Portnoybacteria bacterium RIFCSPHIGHO2_01_FULL_40_12b]OGZ36851.1 MAG: superoxide dismutase, Ni [Candidatus Portnoybacteria bacterium RIFCSPHIGHO2_02_FULL_40_23]OGZ38241.1 MAG: superoxide dismutase, Ni [Candidatus Portnoybacteria bacterium RIFCSPLOWO2_01_FULL_43_11]OGZ39233.1 MAG: superoxide dismutase, Ni [Candidatus Portnoybacteria bacterium RIFCSPHIGHO2_12_FULL_40_11]
MFIKTPKIIVRLAHCDIPCGIYDPLPAQIAAKTVLKMVEQLNGLEMTDHGDKNARLGYLNNVSRRIAVKEEHAQLCKKELEILWSDFFKPEHLEKFPNLHNTFWQAIKLCSKNKQEVNGEAAQKLVEAVDEIAKIFYEAKNAPSQTQTKTLA